MNRRAVLLFPLVWATARPAAPHHNDHRQAVRRTRAGWPVMPFTLTDQDARPCTQEQLAGRWTFVLLGDSTSRVANDAALAALAGLHRRIAGTEAIRTTQVLLLWLEAGDAARARLRSALAGHELRVVGATGSPDALHALLDDLRGEDDAVPRAGTLLLLGPDTSRRAEYLPPFDVPWLTAAFLKARVGR